MYKYVECKIHPVSYTHLNFIFTCVFTTNVHEWPQIIILRFQYTRLCRWHQLLQTISAFQVNAQYKLVLCIFKRK